MFARSIFRSSLRASRRAVSSTSIPHAPTLLPLRNPSLPFRRHASGLPPHERPQRVIHRRFDPDELAKAKPFVNTDGWGQVATGRRAFIFYAICSGSAAIFYFSHLETVPVSGRKRFMYFSDAAAEDEGARLYRQLLQENRNSILPEWDPRVRQVERVMSRLIPATDTENVDWRIHVIESNEANAFVIPGGKVFVMSGILPIAKTDDGLAAILGHEIAHNLARHPAESMSSNFWLIMPLRFGFMVAEILITGQSTPLSRIVGNWLLDFGMAKPASRKQESEADYIGLMIMARSCYDPSAAVGVWQRMQASNEHEIPEWMSTHPANATRITAMQEWLPKAEEARNDSDCSQMLTYSQDFAKAVEKFDPWRAFR